MKDVMGLIYTSKNEVTLRELTVSRAVAALPVAGRYRVIDFILSSMVNSGIRNVGVIMQKNYHSLMDHLGSGKEWDLHTRNDGLFILPPFLTRENIGTYSGIMDAIRSNMGYLRRSQQEYVILANSHTVLNCTFDDLLAFHEDHKADITLVYARKPLSALDQTVTLTPRHVYIQVDGDGKVADLEIGTEHPGSENFYMDILLIRRTLLMQLIEQCFAQSYTSFNRDLLQRYVHNGMLRIYGYEYTGYNRRLETINSYFGANMDMLDPEVRREIFHVNPIYTKVRDEVPARYLPGGTAINSLVADGCVIEGRVENSVLFRGVHVGKDTRIKDSIVMQESSLGAHCEVENSILDKKVIVRDESRLIAPIHYPIVIGKNTVI